MGGIRYLKHCVGFCDTTRDEFVYNYAYVLDRVTTANLSKFQDRKSVPLFTQRELHYIETIYTEFICDANTLNRN